MPQSKTIKSADFLPHFVVVGRFYRPQLWCTLDGSALDT